MCPPVCTTFPEIGHSDEQIILSLGEFTRGYPLPSNVIDYLNPYEHKPSNLPDGIWYLIHSDGTKETAFGFWKAKGQIHEIYLNSILSGFRTTLEFFEGQAPNVRKTDWLMQEYSWKPVWLDNVQDSKSLCRVFHSSTHSPRTEIQPKYTETTVGVKCIGSEASVIPNNSNTPAQESSSNSEVKRVSNSYPDDFLELECFSRGDFLELDDLAEPQSSSSSSENSSCPSRASDEFFDSLALLQELNDEGHKQLQANNLSKYRFSASVRPEKVVMKPATVGSIQSGTGRKPTVERFLTGSTLEPGFPVKKFLERAIADQRQKSGHRIEGASDFINIAAPSASRKAGEKRSVKDSIKRLKEILCCKPF